MAFVARGFAVFCTVDVPYTIINELLDPRPGSEDAIHTWWFLIEDLGSGQLSVPTDPLPQGGTQRKSIVPALDYDLLAQGLGKMTQESVEAGSRDESHAGVNNRSIDTLLFGVLDQQSLHDDTILLVKYDSDFKRDAEGNAVSDEDTDTWVWHTLRVHRNKALLQFVSVDNRPVAEIKDIPSAFDEQGCLRS